MSRVARQTPASGVSLTRKFRAQSCTVAMPMWLNELGTIAIGRGSIPVPSSSTVPVRQYCTHFDRVVATEAVTGRVAGRKLLRGFVMTKVTVKTSIYLFAAKKA